MQNNTKNEFVNDAFILLISTILVKLFGVLFKIPLSYILSDEGMGYFNSAYTVYTCFYVICTAGVPRAVSILTSQERAKNNYYKAELIFKISRNMFGLISFILTILLLLLSPFLAMAVGNKKSLLSIISISFSLFFISISGTLRGYLNGRKMQLPIAISETIEAVCKLTFGLLLALYGKNIGLKIHEISALSILGISVGSAISMLFLSTYIKKIKTTEKTGQNHANNISHKIIIKDIFKISAPLALSSFIMSITNVIDLLLIIRRLGNIGVDQSSATSLYGNYTTLVVPFLTLCIALTSPVSTAALPRFAETKAENNMLKFNNQLKDVMSITVTIGMALTFGFMFYSLEILQLIFPLKSAIVAAPCLTIISPAFLFASLLTTINTSLEAYGKTIVPLVSMSTGAVFKIFLNYLLIGNAKIGINGAALGTVIFYIISLIISLSILVIHTGRKTFLFTVTFKSIIFSTMATVISKMSLKKLKDIFNYNLSIILAGLIFIGIYITLSYLFIFTKNNKEKTVNLNKKTVENL